MADIKDRQPKGGTYEDSLIIKGSKCKSDRTDEPRIEYIKEFQSPDELYEGLIERVRRYHPSDDISMIDKAYEIAREAHKNQTRKSGEPYIIHPVEVAKILAGLEVDTHTLIAAFLHDI